MLSKYLKADYTDEICDTLILPSFWELKEPQDWKAINYLSELYKSDPTLERSMAHRCLLKDIEIMQKSVVPGTVGVTMLSIMSRFNTSKLGKTALKIFYEHVNDLKTSGIKQESSKEKIKSSMMQEVAHDEEQRVQKKLKISTASNNNDNHFIMPERDNEEENIEIKNNIWYLWKKFLDEAQDNNFLPSLSPEKHGVIWYGHDVRCRTSFPQSLYKQLQTEMAPIKQYNICSSYKEGTKNVLQKANRSEMTDSIEALRSVVEGNQPEKKLLIDFFSLFAEQIYDDVGESLSESESCLSNNLVSPCLQACTRMLRCNKYDITYLPGEVELTSMTGQLNKQGFLDTRYIYKADGKIRINTNKQEVLIVEISNALYQATREKINFDHSKAIFGMLAILKTLASNYNFGTFESFKRIKIRFVHVYGHAVRHWTMMTPEPGVYVMSKEQRADIPLRISNMHDELIAFIRLHLNLTMQLQDTLDNIEVLKMSHRKKHEDMMLDNQVLPKEALLSAVVNPTVIRLNETKHTKFVVESPRSPQH